MCLGVHDKTKRKEHINGDHFDNRIENLRFLCPNCHAQTDTYAGKNTRICKEKRRERELDPPKEKKEPHKYICEDCHTKLPKKATRCRNCHLKHKVTTRKVERPTLEQLQQDLVDMSMVKVGQKYGVSDNCIRKWMNHYLKVQSKDDETNTPTNNSCSYSIDRSVS